MTAEQLVSYAMSRIHSKVKFDTENTKVKILYLGQHGKEHFFVLSITPVDIGNLVNIKPVKNAVSILDKIGFNDLHWTHLDGYNNTLYLYYMSIDCDKMLKLHD